DRQRLLEAGMSLNVYWDVEDDRLDFGGRCGRVGVRAGLAHGSVLGRNAEDRHCSTFGKTLTILEKVNMGGAEVDGTSSPVPDFAPKSAIVAQITLSKGKCARERARNAGGFKA